MTNFLEDLPIDPEWLTYLAILSTITFLLSLIVIPWLVIQLPADYFTRRDSGDTKRENKYGLAELLGKIIRNIFGGILIIAGIIMLVLPGQGILTILVGIGLSDFPRKHQLERWFVKRPVIFKALNWLRDKKGVIPLLEP